jgi:hypothetical protein
VARLRQDIAAADGVLFVTPEYNRSIPGVLKNAIDQASRPWGQSKWAGKPAAVAGVSIGAIGTAVAQAHLRSVLSFWPCPNWASPSCTSSGRTAWWSSNRSARPAGSWCRSSSTPSWPGCASILGDPVKIGRWRLRVLRKQLSKQ